MTREGAIFYYTSKQALDFKKAYTFLAESGLYIKHPDIQIISGIYNGDDFEESDVEKIEQMFNTNSMGIHLRLENKDRIFWSFVELNNVFSHNIGCWFDEYHEKVVSEASIRLALSEIDANEEFLGFTIDIFGATEEYRFETIFEPDNSEFFTYHYFPDITFLPKDKLTRVSLNDEYEIIQLNQKFDCIAKDKELSNYLKSLL